MPGLPHPAQAASSGSLSPLTPCSARDPAGLVSYRLRSWGFPFRGLSLPGAGSASRRPLPLLALSSTTAPGPRPSPVRFPNAVAVGFPLRGAGPSVTRGWGRFRARLQGFALVLEVRTPVSGGWPLVGADPLLGFHPSRVFPLSAFVRPMPHVPLTHFSGGVPKQAVTCAAECRSAERWACLSRDCRPSWSFRPRPGTGGFDPGLRRGSDSSPRVSDTMSAFYTPR
jgi:hypothetical protein